MIGDLAEGLGAVLGEYFWAEILAFLLPIVLSGVFLRLSRRFLRAIPEPDYRWPLVGLLGTLLAAILLFVFLVPEIEVGWWSLTPMAFLAAMLIWLIARPGRGPLLLLIPFAVFGMLNCIRTFFIAEIPFVGKASVAGFLIIWIGILLWSIVGVRFPHGAPLAASAPPLPHLP